MPSALAKTEAGVAEIRARSHALPRHARTLLVLVDGTRSADQLLSMVQGASPADLALLLDAGLVAETSRARAPAAPVAPPAAEAAAPGTADASSGEGLSYRELYDSLNALAKEQLGLFKGYRFALEIEKASGIEELRQVAQHLVEEVERAKGESAAQMVRRALGLKR